MKPLTTALLLLLSITAFSQAGIIPYDSYDIPKPMLEKVNTIRTKNISVDRTVWFTNDTLRETLVYEIFRKDRKLFIYHFMNKFLPEAMLNQMVFFDTAAQTYATLEQKQAAIPELVKQAQRLPASFFSTSRNLHMGDALQKVIAAYGNPQRITTYTYDNNVKAYEWSFDIRTAEGESSMQEITLYFRKDKLVAALIRTGAYGY